MKQSLQLRHSQHLALTPQLAQSIRLLQLSTLELTQEVEQIIQANPLLEHVDTRETGPGDDGGTEAGMGHEAAGAATDSTTTETSGPEADEAGELYWAESRGHGSHDEDDDQDYLQPAADTLTLNDHLNTQLSLLPLSGRDRGLVTILIDSLNEDGYLALALDEIISHWPPELELEPIELQTALKYLQNMDPPGVGARNLAECLALQLMALPPDTPFRDLALKAMAHLDLLAARDYARLKKVLGCKEEALRAVQQLILTLNPRPGAAFAPVDNSQYVVPDVKVRLKNGRWTVSLNQEAIPQVRINRMYADILQRSRGNASSPIGAQLQEARWLIKNIQQRFETILRVSQAIVDRQKNFFEHGEIGMRPLVLREIAEILDLSESTVSRVTTQKYMLTPRGIFELKYFFGSHVPTEAGGAASATAIRALIKQLVSTENKKKPYSDSQITDIIAQQGIVVARRTVAKYRESLQIPPVSLRKSI